ncbi:MAG: acyltransferase [Gemmatimonadetes bacterium]|nr:acyltransferase [Gemmatimonadota bacterium]
MLAVVAYHTKAWVLPGGFVGVDVFFVISGFLISGIILQRLQKGTFSIADFYARRIRRIFPALSLVLVTCLAVGWFVLLPGELADLGGDVAAGAGFVSNIRFWTQTNYFGPDVDSKPLLHLWSLGIEEQYYLLWPFVLAFLWRGSHRVAPMVGLMVVSFAISLTLSFTDARSAFYLPVTRLWELLLGSLVAYAVFAHGDPARLVLRLTTRGGGDADAMRIAHTRDAMAWIGLSLIALALALLRTTSVFPGAWALLPTVGTALLISAGPKAWVNRTILSHPAVVGIGLISYPLYLWHWPVLALIRIHYPDVSYVAKGGALLGAFVAAYLTYRLLERWVRHTIGDADRRRPVHGASDVARRRAGARVEGGLSGARRRGASPHLCRGHPCDGCRRHPLGHDRRAVHDHVGRAGLRPAVLYPTVRRKPAAARRALGRLVRRALAPRTQAHPRRLDDDLADDIGGVRPHPRLRGGGTPQLRRAESIRARAHRRAHA